MELESVRYCIIMRENTLFIKGHIEFMSKMIL